MGQERLGPSYFFILLVLGPLNSLPHAAFGWRIHCGVEVTELSTNKQHTLSLMVRTFLKVYMELGSYFLFLQVQIKDIIIKDRDNVFYWYLIQ